MICQNTSLQKNTRGYTLRALVDDLPPFNRFIRLGDGLAGDYWATGMIFAF